MYLNQFTTSNAARLHQILATLETVHGVKINIDLASDTAEKNLNECHETYESLRNRIIKESAFNSYQQNPEYIKSSLILEAVKLMLVEIAPKRRRQRKMNESAMDEEMQTKPTLSTQLSAIAAKIPNTGEDAAAFSNILSSIADKLSEKGTLFGNEMTPDEKMVLGWIKSLPRPVHVGNMIKQGVEKFGGELVAKRMSHIKSLPKVDMDEAALSPEQTMKIVKLGRAMMNYAEKTPATDDKTLAVMNAFTRVGDKLTQMGTAFGPTGLTDNEKKIVKLAQLKMKNAGNLDSELDEDLEIMTAEASPQANPGMDNVHEQLNESDTLSQMPGGATFGQAHHYEYQASMARSELYRNAKYAMSMMKQVDPNAEIPPWIAACLTKAANILDKIFHYLDYYKTFEPDQLPENMAGGEMELGETSGSIARENLMLIMEYSTKLFNMIKPGEKLEGWVAMKLTTASECISSSKHYMDYVQFEQHGADEHFDEGKSVKKALAEDEDPNAQELAKAQIILNAKQISGKIQDIAEDVAKMQVNDLMPLVDSMRTQYGQEAAAGFNESCKAVLEQLLEKTTETKDAVDNAITTLQGGGVPAETSDIEAAGAPPAGEAPAVEEPAAEEPAAEEPTAEEPATEEPLGRAKKPVAESMMTCKECGTGTYMEGRDGKMRCDECGHMMMPEAMMTCKECGTGTYMEGADGKMRCDECGAVMIAEAWGTKMHTAPADMGKWDGYTLAELKARKKKLMDKEERSAKEQKEVKQLNFAIRAKQKNHWGKIKEGTQPELITLMNRTDKQWTAQQKQQAVDEGIFSRKPKIKVTQISPPTPSQLAKKDEKPLKKGEVRVTKMTPDMVAKHFEKDVPAYLRRQQNNEEVVDEVAPPGKDAEMFIKKNKEDFKKRYGDRGEAVLYATAWKKFGPKHEGWDLANAALAESKTLLQNLNQEFTDHKATYKKMVAEGRVRDVLNTGYGLEGEAILQRIKQVNKKIAEQKSVIRQIMQEGVIGMLQNIQSLNKAEQIAAVKESTPYGVIYNTKSGRKSKKMFESAETRTYWLGLHGEKISNVRMIEPETFDAAINTKIKAK